MSDDAQGLWLQAVERLASQLPAEVLQGGRGAVATATNNPPAAPPDAETVLAKLLPWAEVHGGPRLPIGPGDAIAAGEEAWRRFAAWLATPSPVPRVERERLRTLKLVAEG